MNVWYCAVVLNLLISDGRSVHVWNMFDLSYWRCIMKKTNVCPDNDIKFYLYTPYVARFVAFSAWCFCQTRLTGTRRIRIDVRNPYSLRYSGYNPLHKNVLIVHGFNGTESKTPMTLLRDAYLTRDDYNIFTVDYEPIARFPCYLSALSNMKLISQCMAQLYSFIMNNGGDAHETTCVGHSLGAHICGMISNHLTVKQHKIVGLDPARPLVDQYGDKYFRLTRDDAHQVQIVHTNGGVLGEINQVGHVDFCVNGGQMQPGCKGHILRRARCSHFQSVCFFSLTVRQRNVHMGRPCQSTCPKTSGNWGYIGGPEIPMGEDTPFGFDAFELTLMAF